MRFFSAALLIVLAGLQYRLWISDGGIRSVTGLRRSVAAQSTENRGLVHRNDQLAAEVKDLKEGLSALEERARNDLGMIGSNESFYQVVDNEVRGPEATAPKALPLPVSATRATR
jgi:cell division protein FtsB